MAKSSAAQIAASRRYEEKTYDRMNLFVKKGERDRIRAIASSRGMSLNAFVMGAIEKEIARIEAEEG